MSRASQNEEEAGGLEGKDLVATAWNAFRAARAGLGFESPEWDELDDTFLLPFSTAAQTVRDYVLAAESLPEGSGSFADAGRKGFDTFTAAMNQELTEATPQALLPWEAVARHVTNALAWDEEDHGELNEHEIAWNVWARDRQAKLQG
jgi:hypothetical protein